VARFEALRDLEFERVVTRTVLVLLVLALVPALRVAGLRSLSDIGLGRVERRWRHLVAASAGGVASMGMLYGLGAGLGAYTLAEGVGVAVFFKSLAFVVGAFLVALVEETLFRGGLFGAVRSRTRFWTAALFSSLIFSAAHFMHPEPRVSVAHAHWNSALLLLPHVFEPVHALEHYYPFVLTLLLIGLALCLLYEATGSLFAAIGLHAGWILVLRGGSLCFVRVPEVWPGLFGSDGQIAKSWAATLTAGLVVAGLALCQRRTSGRRGGPTQGVSGRVHPDPTSP
jgi:membrane protease YdiL (CAAX protease family)